MRGLKRPSDTPSPIVAHEMTRLAAAALLETFPNTAMTAAYIPGPGRVPSATVRRAAAFIDDHAGQPVTMPEVAAAAGVTARALQYAFRCHYDTAARPEHRSMSTEEPCGFQ